jgi:hypothetical protein
MIESFPAANPNILYLYFLDNGRLCVHPRRQFSANNGPSFADKTKILPFIEAKKDRTSSFNLIHINPIGFVWIMLKFKFFISRALGMTRNTLLTWRLGVASLSLMTAVVVYIFVRIYPPELLTPLQALNTDLAAYTGVFGSAPSFFYTLALGLLIGACASNRLSARIHCVGWIGLAMLLELSQARIIAEPIGAWLSESLPHSIWSISESYWTRGVFDSLDLLATIVGGTLALVFLAYLPLRSNDVRD